MAENRMMLIGRKETFLIRVLLKKAKDAGINIEFVPCTVNDINTRWDRDVIVTLYLDDGERPADDVRHFLSDKMEEEGIQMLVIGEQSDIQYVCDHMHGHHIYRTFTRPLDNEQYLQTVEEIMTKADAGEFKKSILIVDDDPGYLSLVREWLKGTYKVSMANSGLQAIKWLGMNKVDLILLDHEMPVTTGPQVLEMLRSDEETKSIPVMFLTGKSDKESVMSVVSLKPEGYFLKTIQKDELLEKLHEFFVLHK